VSRISIYKNLYIRQVIGRTIFDAHQAGCDFDLSAMQEGWLITIKDISLMQADQICSLIGDSNLFYTEGSEQALIRKWWLYGTKTPITQYHAQEHKLSIFVDSMMKVTDESGAN
jgi:hypothetical protein